MATTMEIAMVPAAFDEENGVLDPPKGVSIEEVQCLSVFRGPMADGTPVVISCYKPTSKEWEEMRKTGRVWLLVQGTTMPPVSLTGHNPFQQEESETKND